MPKQASGVYGFIMAGGSGERFWPLSRRLKPKQCLSILGEGTMLQQACKRLDAFLPAKNIFAMTRKGIEKTVGAQLRHLPKKNIVAEPCGRDTAGCIALAACLVMRENPEGIMAIAPADHWVTEPEKFTRSLVEAVVFTRGEDSLVTFGMKPTEPATGYGYIQAGAACGEKFYRVEKYHEKPDLQTAKEFLKAGNCWWNSGMFVWKAKTILEEIRRYLPQHGLLCDKLLEARSASSFDKTLAAEFPKLPKISIDYAVLQKSDKLVMTPIDFTWDDLGSWPTLMKQKSLTKDAAGNAAQGNAVIVEGRGNFIRTDEEHLVGIVGADDLIVVHTDDATLVCRKDKAQEIKKLTAELEKDKKKQRYA